MCDWGRGCSPGLFFRLKIYSLEKSVSLSCSSPSLLQLLKTEAHNVAVSLLFGLLHFLVPLPEMLFCLHFLLLGEGSSAPLKEKFSALRDKGKTSLISV